MMPERKFGPPPQLKPQPTPPAPELPTDEQIVAIVSNEAQFVAAYYTVLKDKGLPLELAADLTKMWSSSKLFGNDDE